MYQIMFDKMPPKRQKLFETIPKELVQKIWHIPNHTMPFDDFLPEELKKQLSPEQQKSLQLWARIEYHNRIYDISYAEGFCQRMCELFLLKFRGFFEVVAKCLARKQIGYWAQRKPTDESSTDSEPTQEKIFTWRNSQMPYANFTREKIKEMRRDNKIANQINDDYCLQLRQQRKSKHPLVKNPFLRYDAPFEKHMVRWIRMRQLYGERKKIVLPRLLEHLDDKWIPIKRKKVAYSRDYYQVLKFDRLRFLSNKQPDPSDNMYNWKLAHAKIPWHKGDKEPVPKDMIELENLKYRKQNAWHPLSDELAHRCGDQIIYPFELVYNVFDFGPDYGYSDIDEGVDKGKAARARAEKAGVPTFEIEGRKRRVEKLSPEEKRKRLIRAREVLTPILIIPQTKSEMMRREAAKKEVWDLKLPEPLTEDENKFLLQRIIQRPIKLRKDQPHLFDEHDMLMVYNDIMDVKLNENERKDFFDHAQLHVRRGLRYSDNMDKWEYLKEILEGKRMFETDETLENLLLQEGKVKEEEKAVKVLKKALSKHPVSKQLLEEIEREFPEKASPSQIEKDAEKAKRRKITPPNIPEPRRLPVRRFPTPPPPPPPPPPLIVPKPKLVIKRKPVVIRSPFIKQLKRTKSRIVKVIKDESEWEDVCGDDDELASVTDSIDKIVQRYLAERRRIKLPVDRYGSPYHPKVCRRKYIEMKRELERIQRYRNVLIQTPSATGKMVALLKKTSNQILADKRIGHFIAFERRNARRLAASLQSWKNICPPPVPSCQPGQPQPETMVIGDCPATGEIQPTQEDQNLFFVPPITFEEENNPENAYFNAYQYYGNVRPH